MCNINIASYGGGCSSHTGWRVVAPQVLGWGAAGGPDPLGARVAGAGKHPPAFISRRWGNASHPVSTGEGAAEGPFAPLYVPNADSYNS